MLRKIVVKCAEPWKVLGHETILAAEGVPHRKVVFLRDYVIAAKRRLVRDVMLVTDVEVIVAVYAGPDHRRGSHHGHPAPHHSLIHIRARYVLFDEGECRSIDQIRRDDIS